MLKHQYFMGGRPFMGQAQPAAQAELAPLACPTGPDSMDVIDAATGFVLYRNHPGAVESDPVCKQHGYAYDPAAPAPTAAPSARPSPAAPLPTAGTPPASIKWLGPTPGSPYKPFKSSYPPVSSTYTVAQGTPFNGPMVNVGTEPPATVPPPMAPMPTPAPAAGPDGILIATVGAVVLALGVGAYFLIFGK